MLLVLRVLSVAELFIGALLTLGTLVLFANAHFCWFGGRGCGMWEPVIAIYMLPIAIPVFLAGIFHRKQMPIAALVAYLPIVFVVIVLVGQAQLWW